MTLTVRLSLWHGIIEVCVDLLLFYIFLCYEMPFIVTDNSIESEIETRNHYVGTLAAGPSGRMRRSKGTTRDCESFGSSSDVVTT